MTQAQTCSVAQAEHRRIFNTLLLTSDAIIDGRMFYFSESDVQELLPITEAIRLMRMAFEALRIGRAQNQPRRRLILESGSVLHSMAGAVGNYFQPALRCAFLFFPLRREDCHASRHDGSKLSRPNSHRRG